MCGIRRLNGLGHAGLYGSCSRQFRLLQYVVGVTLTPLGATCRSTSSHRSPFQSFRTSSPRSIRPFAAPKTERPGAGCAVFGVPPFERVEFEAKDGFG